MFQVVEIFQGSRNVLCTCDTFQEAQDALYRYHDEIWMEDGKRPTLWIDEI